LDWLLAGHIEAAWLDRNAAEAKTGYREVPG